MAGKPIPGFLCRVLNPETVLLANHDRAPQVNNSRVLNYTCVVLLTIYPLELWMIYINKP